MYRIILSVVNSLDFILFQSHNDRTFEVILSLEYKIFNCQDEQLWSLYLMVTPLMILLQMFVENDFWSLVFMTVSNELLRSWSF